MTSNEPYAAAASQVRKATEQSADAWKEGTKKLFDQVGTIPTMPQVSTNRWSSTSTSSNEPST